MCVFDVCRDMTTISQSDIEKTRAVAVYSVMAAQRAMHALISVSRTWAKFHRFLGMLKHPFPFYL